MKKERLTLVLDETLKRKLKVYSALKGMSITQVIEGWIREYCDKIPIDSGIDAVVAWGKRKGK